MGSCTDYSVTKIIETAPEIVVDPVEHDFGHVNAQASSESANIIIIGIVGMSHYRMMTMSCQCCCTASSLFRNPVPTMQAPSFADTALPTKR